MEWIVAYDISGNLDRERVAARLLSVGVRLQRSVYQVEVDDVGGLLADLSAMIDLGQDVIQAFRQCRSCEPAAVAEGQTGPSMRQHWWVA